MRIYKVYHFLQTFLNQIIWSKIFTHLIQSVKKWGLSACTMTTSKKSLQFFPTMCVIPLSLRTGKKEKIDTRLQQNSLLWLRVESRRHVPQRAYTYTKLKGLLVMRKSFFPLLTSRCKTASVSSPLRIYLSMKRIRTECYFVWSNVAAWCKKKKGISYQDLPWPICTCSLWGEPCQLLPEDYISVTESDWSVLFNNFTALCLT